MSISNIIAATLATVPLMSLAACGSTTKAQRYDDIISMRANDYDIEPREEVISACGLDRSRSYFSYASSDLTTEDQALLGDVGRCLTNGRLAGHSILITGYTDREGGKDYNLELGMSRARAVALNLNERGVPVHRIYLRSRGEDRATGESSGARALERKVEIRSISRHD